MLKNKTTLKKESKKDDDAVQPNAVSSGDPFLEAILKLLLLQLSVTGKSSGLGFGVLLYAWVRKGVCYMMGEKWAGCCSKLAGGNIFTLPSLMAATSLTGVRRCFWVHHHRGLYAKAINNRESK